MGPLLVLDQPQGLCDAPCGRHARPRRPVHCPRPRRAVGQQRRPELPRPLPPAARGARRAAEVVRRTQHCPPHVAHRPRRGTHAHARARVVDHQGPARARIPVRLAGRFTPRLAPGFAAGVAPDELRRDNLDSESSRKRQMRPKPNQGLGFGLGLGLNPGAPPSFAAKFAAARPPQMARSMSGPPVFSPSEGADALGSWLPAPVREFDPPMARLSRLGLRNYASPGRSRVERGQERQAWRVRTYRGGGHRAAGAAARTRSADPRAVARRRVRGQLGCKLGDELAASVHAARVLARELRLAAQARRHVAARAWDGIGELGRELGRDGPRLGGPRAQHAPDPVSQNPHP
jgi:hypothetical protein